MGAPPADSGRLHTLLETIGGVAIGCAAAICSGIAHLRTN